MSDLQAQIQCPHCGLFSPARPIPRRRDFRRHSLASEERSMSIFASIGRDPFRALSQTGNYWPRPSGDSRWRMI